MTHFGLSPLPVGTVALDSPRGGISLETERTVTGMSSKLLLTRATVQDGGNDPYILTELFLFFFYWVGVSGGFGLRILNSTLSYGMSTLKLDFGFISNYSLSPSLSFGLVWALCHWKSCWNTGKGNYTCAPPGAQPADVTVHVLNGKSFQVNSTANLSADSLSLCRLAENTSLFIDGFFLCVVGFGGDEFGWGRLFLQVSIRPPCSEGTGVHQPTAAKERHIWVPNASGPFK